MLYAKLEVITLYSHEHQGNHVFTERISGHFKKISTPLVMLVHSYKTETKAGVN